MHVPLLQKNGPDNIAIIFPQKLEKEATQIKFTEFVFFAVAFLFHERDKRQLVLQEWDTDKHAKNLAFTSLTQQHRHHIALIEL